MKTNEIIRHIEGNGGLDINYCTYAARQDGCSLHEYIRGYVQSYFDCSRYVANKVADYYCY